MQPFRPSLNKNGSISEPATHLGQITPPQEGGSERLQKYLTIKIFLLSALAVGGLFLWQGNKGFNLADEGFLWYGVQRVMLGEVPIRDFSSYEPGRYYWSAALMTLEGNNGIMALRAAVVVFQGIGLFVALLLIARNLDKKNSLYLLLSTVTLLIWMFPRHKLFDITLSILLIAVLAFLIHRPTAKRYFLTGLGLGLVACFGRNHAVYGVAGTLGVMFWLQIKPISEVSFFKGLLLLGAGIVLGFMPILLMVGLVPGFAIAFLENIRLIFELKATNLPLPVPWPWLVNFSALPLGQAIRPTLIGLLFIALMLFGILSVFWVLLQKFRNKPTSPELVAASFLALPYAHYAYSRADVGHLALGIFPFLIGLLIILGKQSSKIKWCLSSCLCLISLWVMGNNLYGWQYLTNKQSVAVEISGSQIFMDQETANDIELLRMLDKKYLLKDQTFLAAPSWPGAYALLERYSPVKEIYPLFPVSNSFQEEEIKQMQAANPQFVILLDVPLDGRNELRFRNTHPLLYQYIAEHFELTSDAPNPTYLIYSKRSFPAMRRLK